MGRDTVEVLRGVDLQIEPYEKLFLRGASGAGKTTLLYTLAGLERPDSGTVEIGHESLYELTKARQAEFRNSTIGYVFQHYFLLPDLTALENVCLPAMMAGKRRGRRERAAELLDLVGLSQRMNHRPTELSGGEQQRVAIARSLVNDPQILFADEPTGNLDSKTGGDVIETLLGIVSDTKKTLIVVTHDSTLAALGDRQLQITDGRIVA
jgi:ABC-type lipoprotein export system ATPase subunit